MRIEYLNEVSELGQESPADEVIAPVILADQRHVERDALHPVRSGVAQVTQIARQQVDDLLLALRDARDALQEHAGRLSNQSHHISSMLVGVVVLI